MPFELKSVLSNQTAETRSVFDAVAVVAVAGVVVAGVDVADVDLPATFESTTLAAVAQNILNMLIVWGCFDS